ncbi:class I SAM-dependent methyltransferase [Brevibacillus invocatus]|uniref:Class I SAM-dependent methyltransferase n=1 Tax=Brevibacillus invocatus TaxID=173959 RepID=A0A3M8CF41_9BACL|nr:class I SAM-dependent methyltransferase [Brevibacillus invocatus]RNB74330.1 class I SAM-dependent methyltransferase [Brevibacillus invocatus]
MEYRGSDFYDNPDHFERYMERRKAEENANDTLEKPVFQELLGCVKGLRILDIGCGDANFGRECLANGCAAYVGLEGSINMVHAGRKTLEGWDGQIVHARMEDWDYPQAEYDLVLSRLAIHYVQDLNSLLQNIYQTLKPNGRLLFSIEHPVITSTLQPSGTRTHWVVDNYFTEGYREQQWMGGIVYKYHRSIETYFIALQKAGFVVEQLRESKPVRAHFLTDETYERRLRIPLFLFYSAKKK